MKTTAQIKKQLRVQNIIFNLLFLAVIALLAWFSTRYASTSDWTYNNRNSLTNASIELLQAMPGPISLNIYLPEQQASREAIEELLKRYQRSKADFSFRFLNPDIEIEMARAENITRYGQSVIKYNGKKEILDNINEPLISNALSRLSREHSPLAIFIDNHGERNPHDSSNIGYSLLAQSLGEKGFRVDTLNLLSGRLPEDTALLVIAGASKQYLPGEAERIQQYIKSGGSLLWLRDPGADDGLTDLASELDIHFENGTLVDADPELRATLRIEHPAMIAVLEYNLHDITKKIPYNTLFMLAGAVSVVESPQHQWETTALFNSRQSTWSETSSLLTKQIDFEQDKGDKLGPLPMALALQKQTDSTQGILNQRVVVVADSDFLANSYIGAGANKMLGENIFNWLTQDEQLLSFDLKNAPDLRLELSDLQVTFIGLSFLVVIPVGLLLSGAMIWRKRKKS